MFKMRVPLSHFSKMIHSNSPRNFCPNSATCSSPLTLIRVLSTKAVAQVFRNFAKFAGKHLCQSFFFNEVAATSLKKRLWHKCFPVNFTKFRRTAFLKEHLRWLLMYLLRHLPHNGHTLIILASRLLNMLCRLITIF